MTRIPLVATLGLEMDVREEKTQDLKEKYSSKLFECPQKRGI
jgi:hypothetical protein